MIRFPNVPIARKWPKRLYCGKSLAVMLLSFTPVARGEVTLTTVGTPAFQVVDTHLYAAATDPQSFRDLFPNHFPARIVHGPPYDQEFADGLALTGDPEKVVFSVDDFTSPSAVHLGFVLTPASNAPTGSAFDFSSDSIIPNDKFPIAIRGDVYLNGHVYEQNAFGANLPAADGFDGASHFVAEFWENSAFAPPGLESLIGNYEYRLTLRDATNSGYDLTARFQAVPEPSSALLLSFASLGWGWFRRR